jgi:predicted nucleic acid-binding protein
MPYVVVDTCVLSYLYNGHSLAESYRSHVEGNTAVISFMTLAELHYGTLKNNWGEPRRADLMTHVAREYILFPFNRVLCLEWARIRDRSRRAGRCIKVADSWIAATAMLYGIPLVTHNRSDYEVLEPDLTVISELPES